MPKTPYTELKCSSNAIGPVANIINNDEDTISSTTIQERPNGTTDYDLSLSFKINNRHPAQMLRVEGAMALSAPPKNEIEDSIKNIKESCNKLAGSGFKLPSP